MNCNVSFDCKAFDFPCLCQLNNLVKILGQKWTTEIITTIGFFEAVRFSQIQSNVNKISPNVLSSKLTQLLDLGLIEKGSKTNISQDNFYRLTNKGEKIWNDLIILVDDFF